MLDDEDFDGMLLVGTLLGGPDFSYTVTHCSGGNFLDYAGLGLLIAPTIRLRFDRSGSAQHHGQHNPRRGVLAVHGRWVCWALVVAGPLYPLYKIWDAAETSKIRPHIFTNEGIPLSRYDSTKLMPWSSVSRALETPQGSLFYQGGRIAAFAPRRCLQGEAKVKIIRKFAGKYVANAKLLV
jgi:hypothetical protein